MENRINFLRNPRFKENKKPLTFNDAYLKSNELYLDVNDTKNHFRANPRKV
jgi:hypothetical protein